MAKTQQVARPLSPHLQIYRFTITMTMSIVHRITGGALYFGTALLVWWLVAAATGPEAYALFQDVAGSWIGRLVLFGYSWALLHHLFSGIRYLIWDRIQGFELRKADMLSWAALIIAFVSTIAVWAVALSLKGVL